MRDRSNKPVSHSIDLVLVTAVGTELAILFSRSASDRERWSLPWKPAQGGAESLDATARRIAQEALGEPPTWIEQIGAFADGKRHPSDAEVSVAFVGLVPHETASPRPGNTWFSVADIPTLSPRHKAMVEGAIAAIQARLDQAPIAFRLLPPTFTLSELQHLYELLLAKRLHKASFRRALATASLVEATDEWRSEGRGRPAQLYRYAPKKKRKGQRGVRFDLLHS